MTILAVDDDVRALDRMCGIAATILPTARLIRADDPLTALAEARKQPVDIAFLDVDMPELDGLDLGQYLKEMYPGINIIYVTETDEYALDAMSLHASGYLLKPANERLIRDELSDLRHPLTQGKRVFAQTFGNFDFFVDGQPIAFKYTRTKEILALLVNNRGAQTTNGEIIACLWEDDGDPEKKVSYLSNLRQDLQNTMTRLKLQDIIVKQRGSLAIAADRIECDLYDWLEKKQLSRYRYMGEYMSQYSWAEDRHAELDEMSYE
ncbi:MAG: response regulator [Clostridia bacterium]|nr:response regulator [Clostridia bacterium]